jgi:hypothetical protein
MTTILGLDPHPGSHTVVALNAHGAILESLRVSNDPAGIEGLLEWRKTFTDRHWAIDLDPFLRVFVSFDDPHRTVIRSMLCPPNPLPSTPF